MRDLLSVRYQEDGDWYQAFFETEEAAERFAETCEQTDFHGWHCI